MSLLLQAQLPRVISISVRGLKHTNVRIPDRIERSSTDILKALSDTVHRDSCTPHYKYSDDPFLMANSNLNKRSYALSKESGRKAARYFLDTYPQFFFRDDAEPKIPRFSYKDQVDANTSVTESDLIHCINCDQLENAKVVYQSLKREGTPISEEVLLSLLQLACFYNSQDNPVSDEFLEDNWFKGKNMKDQDRRKTWVDGQIAEDIFHSMDNKSDEAFNCLIRGYGRFNASEKCLDLYTQAIEQGRKLDTETFNHVLKCVSFARESGDTRWELAMDIINNMCNQKVHPDVTTFNELLHILSRLTTWRHSRNYAQKVMAEMKKVEVTPSIGSYYLLVNIFSNDKIPGAAPQILYEVMSNLKGKKIVVVDPRDLFFFSYAMQIANDRLQDLDLAFDIHSLLLTDDNYSLIGDAYRESLYYQHLFRLMSSTAPVETLMDTYSKFVPHTYIPEPTVFNFILKSINLYDARQYVDQLYKDMITFDFIQRENIITNLLQIMAKEKKDPILMQKFVDITRDLITRIDNFLKEKRYGSVMTSWSGEMVSLCLEIFLNGNELDSAHQVIVKMRSNQELMTGVLETEIMQQLVKKGLQSEDNSLLVDIIRYSKDVGNDLVIQFVKENIDSFAGSDKDKATISELIL